LPNQRKIAHGYKLAEPFDKHQWLAPGSQLDHHLTTPRSKETGIH
jgi:hypothetical protein